MKLFIRNMVSRSCIVVVREVLASLHLNPLSVELGYDEFAGDITAEQYVAVNINLGVFGMALLGDHRTILTERIKNVIVEMVHYLDDLPTVKYSSYISKQLGRNYTYLANVFSQVKGVSIREFIILHKIERAKELLADEGLNLTEVSYRLNYSSVAHLSNQFKKVTGQTPSFFMRLSEKSRIPLEDM